MRLSRLTCDEAGAAPPADGFRPVRWRYAPRSDITAYELALLLPYLLGKAMTAADWFFQGSEQRHLVRLPD